MNPLINYKCSTQSDLGRYICSVKVISIIIFPKPEAACPKWLAKWFVLTRVESV